MPQIRVVDSEVKAVDQSRAGLAQLWALLSLDSKGRLLLNGQRNIIIPASVLAAIEAAGERIIGRGISSILYMAGERFGREMAQAVSTFLGGSLPPAKVLEFIVHGGAMRGFGHCDTTDLDLEAGTGTVRSFDLPWPDDPIPRRDTRCHFTAGFLAGLIGDIRHGEVTIEETKCRSCGDADCEFVLRQHANLTRASVG